MYKPATSEISLFLVPIAERAGLNLTLSQTPKTGFLATWPISFHPGCNVLSALPHLKCNTHGRIQG